MRDSVPSPRYSAICNVLRQWKTSLIPTYRIYRLYDRVIYSVAPLTSRGGVLYEVISLPWREASWPWDNPRSSRVSETAPAGAGSHKGRRHGDRRAIVRLFFSPRRRPTCRDSQSRAGKTRTATVSKINL